MADRIVDRRIELRTYAFHHNSSKTMSNKYDGPLMRIALSTRTREIEDQCSTMVVQLLRGEVVSTTLSMSPRVVTPSPYPSSRNSFRQQVTKPQNVIFAGFVIASPSLFSVAVESMNSDYAFRWLVSIALEWIIWTHSTTGSLPGKSSFKPHGPLSCLACPPVLDSL